MLLRNGGCSGRGPATRGAAAPRSSGGQGQQPHSAPTQSLAALERYVSGYHQYSSGVAEYPTGSTQAASSHGT